MKDREAIEKACRDYVEGYFENSGERISSGVHPTLVKRSVGQVRLDEMTRD